MLRQFMTAVGAKVMGRALIKLPMVAGLVGFWPVLCAMAADLSSPTARKTPSAFQWTGLYFGGQYGYATGTRVGAPTRSVGLGLF